MRRLIVFLPVLILLGCVSPAEQAAVDQARQKALEDWHVCLYKQAILLDDNKSSAESVAMAVRAKCAAKEDSYIRIGISPSTKTLVERKVNSFMFGTVVSKVLEMRRAGPKE